MNGLPAYKLWNKIFSKSHLRDIFSQKIKEKPSVGLDWITPDSFEKSLDSNIDVILRKCNGQSYEFTRYREKLILKGAEKPPRCISIPTVRDKLVLSALNELITGLYGTSVITQMPQTIISEISKGLSNTKLNFFIKADINAFYASINRQILMSQFGKKVRKPEI